MKIRYLLQFKSVSVFMLSLLLLYTLPFAARSKAFENATAESNLQTEELIKLKQAYRKAMSDWAYVLQHYVDEEGRTDFKSLSDNRQPLENMVAFISFASPAMTPELFDSPQSEMAYHINTYNALAMHGVIEEGIPNGFTNFFSRAAFFKFRDVVIGGRVTNLYDYENDIIRPLGEPRVHFVLNCMVKDCPRLPQTPFYAATLGQSLEKATTEFFANKKHFYVDDKREQVFVSEILDFYTEDFVASGKAKDLLQYINPYLVDPIPQHYALRFIDYDWRINAQPDSGAVSGAIETSDVIYLSASKREKKKAMDDVVSESNGVIQLKSSPNHTTVIELYTSQGCSSCPPAEKWLSGFVDSGNLWTEIVPINFHVDYWDYLGWKDPFANNAFGERQRDYKNVGKANTIATPGFALNGRSWNGWFRGQAIPQRVAPLTGELDALISDGEISVTFENTLAQSHIRSDFTAHAALLGFGIETSIKRGENAGRKLIHDFVVIGYEHVSLPLLAYENQQPAKARNEQAVVSVKGHLAVPDSKHIKTTRKALVVWVSQSNDPTPIQVAASWWDN